MNEYVQQNVGLPGFAHKAIGVLALVGNLVTALILRVMSSPIAALQWGAGFQGWMRSSGVYILMAFAAVFWSPVGDVTGRSFA